MLIRDLYEDSIKFEEPLIAHYIFYLLQESLISLEDDVKKLYEIKVDKQKLSKILKQNLLGFSQIKVFALKHSDKYYIFIFAKNKQEAISYFQKTFKRNPLNCNEYSLDTPMNIGNRFLSFRDMRKEQKEFPTVIGFYEKIY